MKKYILFVLVFALMLSCTAHNGRPIQYKAVALYETNDTTTILYTFKDNVLYIDEVGNEGFAYRYCTYKMGDKSFLKFYDENWSCWYEYEFIRRPNGDIVIKCEEGDILLEKQKKIIDLDFS